MRIRWAVTGVLMMSVGCSDASVRTAGTARTASAPTAAPTWTYHTSTDEMTGTVTRSASILSFNTVSFDFPYQGEQRGKIAVRLDDPDGVFLRKQPALAKRLEMHQDDLVVYFSLGKGQISDPVLLLKFDEGPSERFDARRLGDDFTTVVFSDIHRSKTFGQPDDPKLGLTTQLRSSKSLRLQVPVNHEGSPIFRFDIGGLDFTKLKG